MLYEETEKNLRDLLPYLLALDALLRRKYLGWREATSFLDKKGLEPYKDTALKLYKAEGEHSLRDKVVEAWKYLDQISLRRAFFGEGEEVEESINSARYFLEKACISTTGTEPHFKEQYPSYEDLEIAVNYILKALELSRQQKEEELRRGKKNDLALALSIGLTLLGLWGLFRPSYVARVTLIPVNQILAISQVIIILSVVTIYLILRKR